MRSFLVVILFALLPITGIAQLDINQFFDQSSIPLINRSKPLKVEVKWDMDGKSQAFLNESLNYLEEGSMLLALSNIDSFLVRNYKMWVGHYYRGQVLMRLGRYRAAETEFTSVTKLNPSLVEAYIELSEALEYQHKLSQAKEQLIKAKDINPKYVYAFYKLGNISFLQKEPAEALTYYKKCNKIDPRFPDAYMAMGVISYYSNKFDDAISLFNKSLQADTTFTQAYFWRGMAQVQQGKKQECLRDWNQFINHNPRNLFVKTLRGFLNTELGNYEAAFPEFRKLLQTVNVNEDKFQGAQTLLDKRIDLQFAASYLVAKGYGLPEDAFANLKAGFCLMVLGNDKKAMDYLRKAERMSSSPAIYFLIAIAYEHGGVHNLAFQYYSKTLEYDNDVFDAHKKRSIYLVELKRWDAANKDINEMFRLQPNAPSAYRLKGLMEANQRKYKEAITDLTRFIVTDSTDVEALRNRGLCYSLIGEPKTASADFARILKLDESQQIRENLVNDVMVARDTLNGLFLLKDYFKKYGTIEALAEISKILVAQKKYAEATAELNEAREKVRVLEKQNNAIIRYNYSAVKSELSQLDGTIAYCQSLYEEAIGHLTISLKENPNNLESQYLRGKCFVKLANSKKALEDFKILKDKNYKDAGSLYNDLAKN